MKNVWNKTITTCVIFYEFVTTEKNSQKNTTLNNYIKLLKYISKLLSLNDHTKLIFIVCSYWNSIYYSGNKYILSHMHTNVFY